MIPSLIRTAAIDDIPGIVELSKRKRLAYEVQNPRFWKRSENAEAVQHDYFSTLLDRPNVIILVSQEGNSLSGFIIAQINPVPPVYDIGGLNCLIDDFVVDDAGKWLTTDSDLLREVISLAKKAGAAQVVVVCGHHDLHKRKLLDQLGYNLTSVWYSQSIGPVAGE